MHVRQVHLVITERGSNWQPLHLQHSRQKYLHVYGRPYMRIRVCMVRDFHTWSSAGCTRASPVCLGTTVMSLRSFAISVTLAGSAGRGLSGCAASMVFTTCTLRNYQNCAQSSDISFKVKGTNRSTASTCKRTCIFMQHHLFFQRPILASPLSTALAPFLCCCVTRHDDASSEEPHT